MKFKDYVKMAGSISRLDANYHFMMTNDVLNALVRQGELEILPDLYTPYGDLFRLKHPETYQALDLRGRIVHIGKLSYEVRLNRTHPGFWTLERLNPTPDGNRRQLSTTRTLLRAMGIRKALA